ncbi:MAG: glycosyltransferase family 4 protein [bacterium]|nr:glycosyltransferase family 4 protein [bacterium]
MSTNKKVKKIAIFCDFLSALGGCEYYNVLLAKCLKENGIEVRLYIGERPVLHYWINELKSSNIFYRTPHIFHKNLEERNIEKKFVSNYVDEINIWSPDVIHTHPFGKLTISWLENKFSKKDIPIVVTEYTTPSNNTSHWFDKEYIKYLKKVSIYIATCQAVEDGIKKYFHFKGKIVKIPHLVVDSKIEKVNLNNIYSMAFLGRLSPEKGVSSLILAWNFLIQKVPQAKLHIYGGGNAEGYLKGLVKSLNLENSIIFEGLYKPYVGINEVVKKHLIFIQPSHFESIPTTIIELMLRQRVVIASNVGGIPELIKKQSGYIYKNGSVESLAVKIINVLLNKRNLEKIAVNARNSVLKKYNIKINVNKVIKLYNSLIN